MTPETLWSDTDYQIRIGALASAMRLPWPITTSLANVHEYRAHLVLFRLHNEIDEHLFAEGMEMAARMERRIEERLNV